MPTYLVTGGAGFIGSNLVEALLERGITVRVLDNLSTGRRSNVQHLMNDIEFIEGDIRSMETVNAAARGVEVVFHEAALVSVPASVEDPVMANEMNVTGTLNVLVAARDAGARRLVLASSAAIYGDNPVLPKVETMLPEPLSPYAVSKLADEHYCEAFTKLYGLPTIALRYFNVFGPRQDPASPYSAVIPIFLSRMARGEPPTLRGDGLQTRDFVYVSDVVQANLLAAEAPPERSGAFNVAQGQRTSLLDLIDAINQILGTQMSPNHGPPSPGDVRDSVADITKIRGGLGFSPSVSLQEGLERTAAYFLEH